jgi:hypothetical protein
MKQLCNLAYAILIENRTKPQIAELEVLLTEPTRKDEMIERQNAEAMKMLTGSLPGGMGLLVPFPKKKSESP